MPKATRLSLLPNQPGNMRTATREAMATLWTIEGHKGLFWYVQGCKAGHMAGGDEIVAEAGSTADRSVELAAATSFPRSSFAVFKRDETVEFLVCHALGIQVP